MYNQSGSTLSFAGFASSSDAWTGEGMSPVVTAVDEQQDGQSLVVVTDDEGQSVAVVVAVDEGHTIVVGIAVDKGQFMVAVTAIVEGQSAVVVAAVDEGQSAVVVIDVDEGYSRMVDEDDCSVSLSSMTVTTEVNEVSRIMFTSTVVGWSATVVLNITSSATLVECVFDVFDIISSAALVDVSRTMSAAVDKSRLMFVRGVLSSTPDPLSHDVVTIFDVDAVLK